MRWMKLSFALSSHDSWYIIFGLCIDHMILVSVVFVGLSYFCCLVMALYLVLNGLTYCDSSIFGCGLIFFLILSELSF